jgi:hypothetical protein
MPTYVSKLVLPVNVDGTITNVEFTIKDQEARDAIASIGDALYWIGVTTTELTDGDTTNPITVGGESVTAKLGGMAQYDGEEFIWNGSAWQSVGKNNFGDLAFKNTATGDFTPQGTVAITKGTDTTSSVTGIASVGTLPAWSISGEVATFSAGTLPQADADATTVITARGTDTAAFTGTQGSVTVS